MLKFLKMTVAEDAITTVEVQVVVLAEAVQVVTEVQHQEEKAILHQDVKVLVDLEAIEVQRHAKVVLAEEANPEVHQPQELAVSLTEVQDLLMLLDVMVVLLKDQQDVLKVLATHQEKEDRGEVN